jgi:UDP-3-O-[3-hydroxymyristoyl] glucosamine N-acyltransferase
MISNLIPKSIYDDDFNELNIGFCTEENLDRLFKLKNGTVFVPDKGSLRYIPIARRTRVELILVDNPRKAFNEVLNQYNPNHKTQIHPTAIIGEGTVIHEGTVIEEGVVIGNNCTIGAVGFGYEDDELIAHKGIVKICKGSHIANNVCIDRAVIGETLIGEEVKIDNLVHIAHGASIGKRSMIIAGAVVCGSVTIGDNVWVAPNSSIRQKLNIGDNSVIGLGAVVVKDVKKNDTVAGCPAKSIKK